MTREEKKASSPLKNEKLKKLGSMEPERATKLSSLHYELEEDDFKAVDVESVEAGGLDMAGGGAPSFGPDNKMVSNVSTVKDASIVTEKMARDSILKMAVDKSY